MKKLAVLIISLLCAQLVSANTSNNETEKTSLTSDNLVSALVDPNTESNEFSTTHDATPPSATEYEAIYINKLAKIIPKTKHEQNRTLFYSIDATYPQISGRSISDAERTFNQRIMAIIDKEMQQFKNSVQLYFPQVKTLPKEVRNNYFKIDYDMDVIPELAIVSVRFTIQGMQAGRAHPFRSHTVLNYDLIHNKELALGDLFKADTKYLEAIAKFSTKKLNSSVDEKDKWMIEEGTKAIAKNYKNWNIEKDAILITFDEYQVAPYVYGPQEVEIPYKDLQNLLSSEAQIISSIKENTSNIG